MYAWAVPKPDSLNREASLNARAEFDRVLYLPWDDRGKSTTPDNVSQAVADEEMRLFSQASGVKS